MVSFEGVSAIRVLFKEFIFYMGTDIGVSVNKKNNNKLFKQHFFLKRRVTIIGGVYQKECLLK